MLDLENSNLPLDYFTSVLPRAQYGDESAVPVSFSNASSYMNLHDVGDAKIGPVFDTGNHDANDGLVKENSVATTIQHGSVSRIKGIDSGTYLTGLNGYLTSDSTFKISALRSATALQKYKEIQNSNDPDFAAQVLAHFGIKPKTDTRTSVFIGGDDKTLSINPQVNTNFQDGGEPEIKAIGIGDLSAECKFTSSTYGIIIGIYRDWETT